MSSGEKGTELVFRQSCKSSLTALRLLYEICGLEHMSMETIVTTGLVSVVYFKREDTNNPTPKS
jgi:hypothetical protein